MRSTNTFGVHFITRPNRKGSLTIYARIVVNQSRCELAFKQTIEEDDWNSDKGLAKSKTNDLKLLNGDLEEWRSKLIQHYQDLVLKEEFVSAEAVKNAFLGISEKKVNYTLLWLASQHNLVMQKVLKPGSLKNYYTTEKYLKQFLARRYKGKDVYLRQLNYEFITAFETFIRYTPIKDHDPCTTNGTMKHMERLKKMVNWAVKNEWLEKNPFWNYRLKFKKHERGFLNQLELSTLENYDFNNASLSKVRDLFVFSCYTGLSFIDLIELKPQHIINSFEEMTWINTNRAKTDTAVNVPLLGQAKVIIDKYMSGMNSSPRETVFPKISNQEINRSLKVIGESCGISKYLTFHLARHTFATTVTLMNGVPIETISKMLGHTKLSTTMIYARVTKTKIGLDMLDLQKKMGTSG